MSNNIDTLDATDQTKTVKTTETATVHVPHHNLDVSPIIGAIDDAAVADPTASGSLIALHKGLMTGFGQKADSVQTDHTQAASLIAFVKGIISTLKTLVVLAAGNNFVGLFGGSMTVASQSTTRPNDTNVYAVGDIIANSTTGASVVPLALTVARANDKTGAIRRLYLKVNDSAWLNKTIRVHLYKDTPTCAAGDNGVWAGNTSESGYLGYADVILDRQFSDFVAGFGVPAVGNEFNFAPHAGAQTVQALLEAQSVVTPAAAKAFTLYAETYQN